jgi:gamma-glutamyltranspeptidase / glutathione hydrolase
MSQTILHPTKRVLPWLAPSALAALTTVALLGCGGNDGATTVIPAVPQTPALVACLQGSGTGGVVVGSGLPGDPAIPEPASGFRTGLRPVTGRSFMAVTANPLATRAGCNVLAAGGTAVDAAVAVQLVLGLVEPQSSGIGGGAFMLHYRASTRTLQSYDGRETAPAAATPDYLRFISATDQRNPLPDLGQSFLSTKASGRSIGTPGVMRLLEAAYQDHGSRPWASLFQPAIDLSNNGFAISGRMANAIALAQPDFLRDPEAAAYFLNPDFTPRALGTTIRNPAYASTLNILAQGGANAFYSGPVAQSIVTKINVTSGGVTSSVAITPGLTTLADLANYSAVRRPAVCSNYRNTVVCGMGPPSSGGIAVAQTLGILDNFNLAALAPATLNGDGGRPSVQGVHLVAEAERLAYADRNQYVADTDFVALPGQGISSLIDPTYLRNRSALISTTRSLGTALPGTFANMPLKGTNVDEGKGTTHMSIIDQFGNVVVMTTTVESSMGSFHFTRGFLLNNQLTDFSFAPSDAVGLIANRVAANKRPRSSMAPTIVFNRNTDGTRGEVLMATGSPGGAAIIQFVVKTIVSAIDWRMDAQQASAMVNFGSANGPTTGVGGEHPAIDVSNNGLNDPLLVGLRALGHTVSFAAQSSGVSTIIRTTTGSATGTSTLSNIQYVGGADPRREGLVLSDGAP